MALRGIHSLRFTNIRRFLSRCLGFLFSSFHPLKSSALLHTFIVSCAMPSQTVFFSLLAILCGIFYQMILKDLLFVTFGVGRTYQRIEEFPYDCRRLRHPLLESCEDLVLDSEGRTLYAACSTSLGRKSWSPGSVCSSYQSVNFSVS